MCSDNKLARLNQCRHLLRRYTAATVKFSALYVGDMPILKLPTDSRVIVEKLAN